MLTPLLRPLLSSPVHGLFGREEEVSSDLPANAIYANGEAIPDPSGTGYLTFGVST